MNKFALNVSSMINRMVNQFGYYPGLAREIAIKVAKRADIEKAIPKSKLALPPPPKKPFSYFDSWPGKRYLAELNPEMDTDALMKIRGYGK